VQLRAIAAALAIQGHHIGLEMLSTTAMRNTMDPEILLHHHPLALTLSETSFQTIAQRFEGDGLKVVPPQVMIVPRLPALNASLDTMLDVQMLYSCLVDADFLDTEAHFNQNTGGYKVFREGGPALKPTQALALVTQGLAAL